MTKVVPILPTTDEEKAKANVQKLLEAAAAVGVALDPQGFTHAWLADNTRVVVAYDEDKPVGFGIMAFGRRYFDGNFTASVLLAQGDARKQVLEFFKDNAAMLGAATLFYEGDELGGELAEMRALKVD